ncbi:acylphosphatase-2 isoform X2 [Canis lupus familiaris]|uniref:acylphosphatase-2 isoform X2 n=1 Tax=Canis lupus familiaris TaxID=9615 RepID=UPI0018F62E7E|nr:acylphosphatase-2 isoform X2 [Canis lupus familiaris]XP_022280443.2 acylphosphatase-2 isoform X2 [Canis lupus familiaris]XP_022280444.2 acylphosphatase-2 isoform X2 [Canis lupus familiaris]XP_022280445.2 acylphosphatase-2 isoform X2 [Canis lupus familiaris]XP_022280446.2 acylphosphatase-2 isoform X2 [Canis lupus familiaris]XP_022280447.2 acylphosphatase-2 isoform X2 [Canis lupus familiaris]XP_038503587.1 acylphosphatase-2 isoform X2 [Canis lupus familiaris]XP_038536500.1 acylphosphatase-2
MKNTHSIFGSGARSRTAKNFLLILAGVCFRMYTEDEAKKIGVVGWVKNTSKGTVTGQVQGPEEKVNSMVLLSKVMADTMTVAKVTQKKYRESKPGKGIELCGKLIFKGMSWLSKVGSPSSRIDRTNFSNEKTISKVEYSNFSIRY